MSHDLKIESLSEFVSAVEAIRLEWTPKRVDWYLQPWFRGHRDADWPLRPGWYRNEPVVRGVGEKYYSERQLMEEFRLRAPAFVSDLPANDWQWLFLMQHYGLPTRLLDWTESALFALFFAVREKMAKRCDAAVWVMNPWWLNKRSLGEGFDLFLASDSKASSYAPQRADHRPKGKVPLAVRATRSSPRIAAQRGVFTVHGDCPSPLEELVLDDSPDCNLRRWTVPHDRINGIRTELTVNGILETLVFPELTGLSTEIRRWFLGEW